MDPTKPTFSSSHPHPTSPIIGSKNSAFRRISAGGNPIPIAQQIIASTAHHSKPQSFSATELSSLTRTQFDAAMDPKTSLGKHLLEKGRYLLHDFLTISFQQNTPREAFTSLVKNLEHQGWPKEVITQILTTLAPLVPLQKASPIFQETPSRPLLQSYVPQSFNHVMDPDTKLGDRLSLDQKNLVTTFLNTAFKKANPKEAFNELIQNEGSLRHGGWKKELASLIVSEFAPFFSKTPPKTDLASSHNSFIKSFNQTPFGTQIRSDQRSLLIDILNQSVQTVNPREFFTKEVNRLSKLSNPPWGKEKATHIIQNLASFVPLNKPSLIQPSIKQIASSGLVCFYKNGPTASLGNFASCPNGIQIYGKKFQCAEAAFQWRKLSLIPAASKDPALNQLFKATGEEAFQISRAIEAKYPGQYPKGWITKQSDGFELRDHEMRAILEAKFHQNPTLMQELKETKDAYLLEHQSWARKDSHWSDNHDGTGQNTLGLLLMSVRQGISSPLPLPPFPIKHYSEIANQGLPYTID